MSENLKEKSKSFHKAMEENGWFDLETLSKKSNSLEEAKKAYEFFRPYLDYSSEELKEIMSGKNSHYWPWNAEKNARGRYKHKKTGKEWGPTTGHPLDREGDFVGYMEELKDLVKHLGGEVEDVSSHSGFSAKNQSAESQKENKSLNLLANHSRTQPPKSNCWIKIGGISIAFAIIGLCIYFALRKNKAKKSEQK